MYNDNNDNTTTYLVTGKMHAIVILSYFCKMNNSDVCNPVHNTIIYAKYIEICVVSLARL